MTINSIAAITNVALCSQTLDMAINRQQGLPGMVVFYGYSGLGKSFAASHAANHHDAVFVQCKSTWKRTAFLEALATELGLIPAKTIAAKMEQICTELMLSQRPVIIDEADYMADKSMVMMLMDIYEGSQAPIMLIGEERLPAKLSHYEKIHNRIIQWAPAQTCELHDIDQLAPIYAPGIDIDHQLLANLHDATKGVTRRICVNLSSIAQFAKRAGVSVVNMHNYTEPFFTSQAPKRRKSL